MKLARKDFPIGSAALQELEQCPATGVYVLDATEEERPKPHMGMWWGIFLHRFLEYAILHGREYALDYVRPKMAGRIYKTCSKIDVDALPKGDPEVPMAHNVIDGTGWRIVGKGAKWSKSLDVKTTQYGKADLISERYGRPLVVDWKSGNYVSSLPSDSTQLLGLAAAVSGETTAEAVDIALCGVMGDGSLRWRYQTLERSHLDSYAIRAKNVHLRVLEDRVRADQGIEPAFVKGPLCDWCDLKPVCKAHL
jgi:hypothetical protein